MKSNEVGDRGSIDKKYSQQLTEVQQGVDEASLQERVPPGYHDGIKRYFDNLGPQGDEGNRAKKTPGTDAKGAPAAKKK